MTEKPSNPSDKNDSPGPPDWEHFLKLLEARLRENRERGGPSSEAAQRQQRNARGRSPQAKNDQQIFRILSEIFDPEGRQSQSTMAAAAAAIEITGALNGLKTKYFGSYLSDGTAELIEARNEQVAMEVEGYADMHIRIIRGNARPKDHDARERCREAISALFRDAYPNQDTTRQQARLFDEIEHTAEQIYNRHLGNNGPQR
jgi:hypothetical protein